MKHKFDLLDSVHLRFINQYARGEPLSLLISTFKKEGRELLDLKKDLKSCLSVDCDFEMIRVAHEFDLFEIDRQFKENWRGIAFGAAANAYFSCKRLSYKNSHSRLDVLYKKSLYMYRQLVFKKLHTP